MRGVKGERRGSSALLVGRAGSARGLFGFSGWARTGLAVAILATPTAGASGRVTLAVRPEAHQEAHSGGTPATQDLPALYAEGEASLRAGELDRATAAFKKVLAADPNAAGAYANLGVIAMRRQQWPQALELLGKAEHLAPSVAGIRLNIGLVYYRQNDFHSAIAPFESVVRDQPESVQARYLLGLCYFFTERYGDAVRLWGRSGRRNRRT